MPLYRQPRASSTDPQEVVLYDSAGNVITDTEENGDNALDVHVSNSSIEQTIGDAANTLVIVVGGQDASGDVRSLRVSTTGLQVDPTVFAGTPLSFQLAVATATEVQVPKVSNVPSVPYRLVFSVD